MADLFTEENGFLPFPMRYRKDQETFELSMQTHVNEGAIDLILLLPYEQVEALEESGQRSVFADGFRFRHVFDLQGTTRDMAQRALVASSSAESGDMAVRAVLESNGHALGAGRKGLVIKAILTVQHAESSMSAKMALKFETTQLLQDNRRQISSYNCVPYIMDSVSLAAVEQEAGENIAPSLYGCALFSSNIHSSMQVTAMEYIDGLTLQAMIQDGVFSDAFDSTVPYMYHIYETLTSLYNRLHESSLDYNGKDIKEDNIIYNPEDVVSSMRLLDVGSANFDYLGAVWSISVSYSATMITLAERLFKLYILPFFDPNPDREGWDLAEIRRGGFLNVLRELMDLDFMAGMYPPEKDESQRKSNGSVEDDTFRDPSFFSLGRHLPKPRAPSPASDEADRSSYEEYVQSLSPTEETLPSSFSSLSASSSSAISSSASTASSASSSPASSPPALAADGSDVATPGPPTDVIVHSSNSLQGGSLKNVPQYYKAMERLQFGLPTLFDYYRVDLQDRDRVMEGLSPSQKRQLAFFLSFLLSRDRQAFLQESFFSYSTRYDIRRTIRKTNFPRVETPQCVDETMAYIENVLPPLVTDTNGIIINQDTVMTLFYWLLQTNLPLGIPYGVVSLNCMTSFVRSGILEIYDMDDLQYNVLDTLKGRFLMTIFFAMLNSMFSSFEHVKGLAGTTQRLLKLGFPDLPPPFQTGRDYDEKDVVVQTSMSKSRNAKQEDEEDDDDDGGVNRKAIGNYNIGLLEVLIGNIAEATAHAYSGEKKDGVGYNAWEKTIDKYSRAFQWDALTNGFREGEYSLEMYLLWSIYRSFTLTRTFHLLPTLPAYMNLRPRKIHDVTVLAFVGIESPAHTKITEDEDEWDPVYMFHGTVNSVWPSILMNDMQIIHPTNVAGGTVQLYGSGIYATNDVSLAFEYTGNSLITMIAVLKIDGRREKASTIDGRSVMVIRDERNMRIAGMLIMESTYVQNGNTCRTQ